MWSAVEFCFVVVLPVCTVTILIDRWLQSITAVDGDFPDAESVRRAAREMSDRVRNLEQILGETGGVVRTDSR